MLSVAEALHQVLECTCANRTEQVQLADAVGSVLAEDIASDVDSPPHDKSIVDGYAVRGEDLVHGRAELAVLEEIIAGAMPTRVVGPAHCSRIMTGAPLPKGVDSVVMVERTQLTAERVQIDDERFRTGQNVMRRAASLHKGEIVLRTGAEIGLAEIGLLAEVGRSRVQVVGQVQVAILATGNELVPHDQTPTAGHIRNSNGPMLAAAVRRTGAMPVDLGIARDRLDDLRQTIAAGLKHDVLVLSGGVSAGVLDLVPAVLAELRVRQVFHKVRLKPGKPLWFGVVNGESTGQGSGFRVQDSSGTRKAHGGMDEVVIESTGRQPPSVSGTSPVHSSGPILHTSGNRCLVFGLPGNPVSSFVCFELFVKPAIARLAGRPWTPPHPTRLARLSTAFQQHGERTTYHPAMLSRSPEGWLVEPTTWKGSSDLRGFVGANSLAVFPPGDREFAIGETIEALPL
ncbi:MAG: molybdopterin molybdotransferase MoeA [Pirellulales bacterium]|nr:molybdopterin molybdotransferase MoeA [Pirellulales bacterium]